MEVAAYDPISESKMLPIQVFQAKSHIDKQLRSQSTVASYIYPIQVDTTLTDHRIVDLQGNQGDNISAKNRNYCELTATYYAWKHSRYVKEGEWIAMLQALEEVAPEYLATYEKSVAAREQFFHNFNMLIAKASVFDDYCDFLFKVLERTEELTIPKGWERADRFAGYLGENLTTIYFIKNRDKWKIAYAGKFWLT